MMLGIGIGAIMVPFTAQRLIAMFGWRMTYAMLGFATLVIALPIAAAFLKNDPKDKGLLRDGVEEPDENSRRAAEEPKAIEGLTWHQTWHTSTLWLMVSTFFLAGASVHACVLHMGAMLSDRGVTAQSAA